MDRKLRLLNILLGFNFTTDMVVDVLKGVEKEEDMNAIEKRLYKEVSDFFKTNPTLEDIYLKYKGHLQESCQREMLQEEFLDLIKQ